MDTTIQKPTLWALVGTVSIALFAVVAFAHAQVASGSISKQMGLGSRGTDVTKLQTLLASNHDLYPEALVTGYYGPLTAKAVAQFQLAYGLPPVGRVGPMTLTKVNGILAMPSPVLDIYAPPITNVSVAQTSTSATVTWTTGESARGKVYFDTIPLTGQEVSAPMTEPYTSGSVVAESTFGINHSVVLSNLTPGRTYYYLVESADAAGNTSVTVPATFVTTQ